MRWRAPPFGSFLRRRLHDRFSNRGAINGARVALGVVGIGFAGYVGVGAFFLRGLLAQPTSSHGSLRTHSGSTKEIETAQSHVVDSNPAAESLQSFGVQSGKIAVNTAGSAHPYIDLINSVLADRQALIHALDDPHALLPSHSQVSIATLWSNLDCRTVRDAITALLPHRTVSTALPAPISGEQTDSASLHLAMRLFDDILVPMAQRNQSFDADSQRIFAALHDCSSRLAWSMARQGQLASVQLIVRRVYDECGPFLPATSHCLAALAHALLVAAPSASSASTSSVANLDAWIPWRDMVHVSSDLPNSIPLVSRLWTLSLSFAPANHDVSQWMQPVVRAIVRALCVRGHSAAAIAFLTQQASSKQSESLVEHSHRTPLDSISSLPSLDSLRGLVSDFDARSLALLLHNLAHHKGGAGEEVHAAFAWRLMRACLPVDVSDRCGVSALDIAGGSLVADTSDSWLQQFEQSNEVSTSHTRLSLEALTSLLSASAHAGRIDKVDCILNVIRELDFKPDAHMFDRLIRSLLASPAQTPQLWWLSVQLYSFARAQNDMLPAELHRLLAAVALSPPSTVKSGSPSSSQSQWTDADAVAMVWGWCQDNAQPSASTATRAASWVDERTLSRLTQAALALTHAPTSTTLPQTTPDSVRVASFRVEVLQWTLHHWAVVVGGESTDQFLSKSEIKRSNRAGTKASQQTRQNIAAAVVSASAASSPSPVASTQTASRVVQSSIAPAAVAPQVAVTSAPRFNAPVKMSSVQPASSAPNSKIVPAVSVPISMPAMVTQHFKSTTTATLVRTHARPLASRLELVRGSLRALCAANTQLLSYSESSKSQDSRQLADQAVKGALDAVVAFRRSCPLRPDDLRRVVAVAVPASHTNQHPQIDALPSTSMLRSPDQGVVSSSLSQAIDQLLAAYPKEMAAAPSAVDYLKSRAQSSASSDDITMLGQRALPANVDAAVRVILALHAEALDLLPTTNSRGAPSDSSAQSILRDATPLSLFDDVSTSTVGAPSRSATSRPFVRQVSSSSSAHNAHAASPASTTAAAATDAAESSKSLCFPDAATFHTAIEGLCAHGHFDLVLRLLHAQLSAPTQPLNIRLQSASTSTDVAAASRQVHLQWRVLPLTLASVLHAALRYEQFALARLAMDELQRHPTWVQNCQTVAARINACPVDATASSASREPHLENRPTRHRPSSSNARWVRP